MRARATFVLLALGAAAGLGFRDADVGQTTFYAQTAWATIHRDARGSDFAPFVAPLRSRVKWTALEGATTITSVTFGPEGHRYVTTGRGPGTSHLHAFDRDGNLLWESAPQRSLDDLDALAVGGAPLVDRRGHVYAGDANQLWSFDANGRVRWTARLPEGGGSFVSLILTRDGLVGGVTTGGKVALYHRRDGTLARPVLDLPGGAGPPCQAVPPGLWDGGLLDPAIVSVVFCALAGLEVEVANTPALHPRTGRIFVPAAGASPDEGVLYGIDVLPERLEIAFAAPLGAGSGTSPAVAPDGSAVYAAGQEGVLIAVDTGTGEELWRAADTGGLASPAVGPDGTVYSGGGSTSLVALRPDGSEKWRRRYDELAAAFLPAIEPVPPFLPSAQPVARTNNPISVSARHVWVVLSLGYEVLNPFTNIPVATPNVVVLAALDPEDGSLAAPPQLLRDTSEAVTAIDADGSLYVSHAAGLTSVFTFFFNAFLPVEVRVPGPPTAGITVLEPLSFLEHVRAGIDWVRALDAEALAALGSGETDVAFTAVRRGWVQLDATAASSRDAADRGELDAPAARAARGLLLQARSHLLAARIALGGERPAAPRARLRAASAIRRAERALDRVERLLP